MFYEQIQTDTLHNGAANSYAAGLSIHNIMGWKNISHDGATASYRAYLEMFPEMNLSIALLSNTSEFGIRDMENKIRNIFVENKGATAKADEIDDKKSAGNKMHLKLSQTYLQSLAGMYVNERTRSTLNLSVKNDTLILITTCRW